MIGVMFSSKNEWIEMLKIYNILEDHVEKYPFGEYYKTKLNNKEIVFFRTGSRKVLSSGACQYIIDKFSLKKIINVGTCTAINDDLNYQDIIIPTFLAEYDLTIREIEPLIKESSMIELKESNIDLDYYHGLIVTSDRALVTNKDLLMLRETDALAADTESTAACIISLINNVDFISIKGVTDRPMNNYDEQLEVYEENYKKVIKNIVENYIMEFI